MYFKAIILLSFLGACLSLPQSQMAAGLEGDLLGDPLDLKTDVDGILLELERLTPYLPQAYRNVLNDIVSGISTPGQSKEAIGKIRQDLLKLLSPRYQKELSEILNRTLGPNSAVNVVSILSRVLEGLLGKIPLNSILSFVS